MWTHYFFVPIVLIVMGNLAPATQGFTVLSRHHPHSHALSMVSIGDETRVVETSSSDDDDRDVQICLDRLEKRLQQGPGSLTPNEVTELISASDRIVENMKVLPPSSPITTTSTTTKLDVPSLPPIQIVAPEPWVDPTTTPVEDKQTTPNASVDKSFIPASSNSMMSDGDDQDEKIMALKLAITELDVDTISSLLQEGYQLDEEMTNAAFWEVVKAVDEAEEADQPLSGKIPQMLHFIFEADLQHLLQREHTRFNLTCMQPDESGGLGSSARRMNYIFDDSSHKDLPLAPGRRCEDGQCCDTCSRNIFPTFATDAETNFDVFPELKSFTFNELETTPTSNILQFVRLTERVRRTMAYEYGLPLKTILPLQAYSRKYVAGTTQKGGGGGEGDFVTLHTDEATHSGYHYSCVIYLSTQGKHFEGGNFVFNDPLGEDDERPDPEVMERLPLEEQIRRAGRKLSPFHPTKGAAVIFSSGWENMHEVEKITSGVRYAVPCFFTTCPVPEAAYDQMVQGKPKTNEEIADDWLHLLLAHRQESPMESVGRVKELLMKWHYMCAPLSEHSSVK